ncbi:hypothetical protein T492DRAFT_1139088 [Pavlovales sp. CCMP2436]|nr:hypothetical protein T492DRAFT_1139088 [Pavlovales sp. CCMP2436]
MLLSLRATVSIGSLQPTGRYWACHSWPYSPAQLACRPEGQQCISGAGMVGNLEYASDRPTDHANAFDSSSPVQDPSRAWHTRAGGERLVAQPYVAADAIGEDHRVNVGGCLLDPLGRMGGSTSITSTENAILDQSTVLSRPNSPPSTSASPQ